MVRKRSWLGVGFTGLAAFLFAFPMLWTAFSSVMSTTEIIEHRSPFSIRSFLPLYPTIENYRLLFGQLGFLRNILNTGLVATSQAILVVATSALTGYALARIKFRGRTLVLAAILFLSFVNQETLIVPLYRLVGSLGMVSTYIGIFLPFSFSPFGIFLMTQSFSEMPAEVEDAARLDGASTWQIFLRVALPCTAPALAVLGLMELIWSWNSYLWPLVIMQDPAKQTIQVVIAAIHNTSNFPMDGPLFAAATVVTLPLIVLSVALQRHYVRGLIGSGLK